MRRRPGAGGHARNPNPSPRPSPKRRRNRNRNRRPNPSPNPSRDTAPAPRHAAAGHPGAHRSAAGHTCPEPVPSAPSPSKKPASRSSAASSPRRGRLVRALEIPHQVRARRDRPRARPQPPLALHRRPQQRHPAGQRQGLRILPPRRPQDAQRPGLPLRHRQRHLQRRRRNRDRQPLAAADQWRPRPQRLPEQHRPRHLPRRRLQPRRAHQAAARSPRGTHPLPPPARRQNRSQVGHRESRTAKSIRPAGRPTAPATASPTAGSTAASTEREREGI